MKEESKCIHSYTVLSDDRVVMKHRNYSTYKRTVEFYCNKCLDIKRKEECVDSDTAMLPDWTKNISN